MTATIYIRETAEQTTEAAPSTARVYVAPPQETYSESQSYAGTAWSLFADPEDLADFVEGQRSGWDKPTASMDPRGGTD
jgi:hypothetical protein